MNQNNFLTKQNIIISSIIIIILFYFSYNTFSNNKVIENLEEKTKYEKPRITSKDIDKYIQKEFSKVIKIFAKEVQNTAKTMSEFNHNFLLKSDYLNFRNSLFTKDIEKYHILVDSKSMKHCCVVGEECNCSSHYHFHLDAHPDTNYKTSGFGTLKNVIGFRCIRAFLPSLPWNLHENNNIIKVTVGINEEEINLGKGFYGTEELANLLTRKLNETFYGAVVTDPPPPGAFRGRLFHCLYLDDNDNPSPAAPINIPNINYRTNITGSILGDLPGKRFIIFLDGNQAFTINWGNLEKSSNRLFGFVNRNYTSVSDPQFLFNNGGGADQQVEHCVSNLMPDLTNHFVDLVIDEIPYIACKKNPLGKSIIERIPTDAQTGGHYIEHNVSESEYFSQNYYHPISLSKLSIKLYDDTLQHLYFTNNLDNSFIFEVTMLKNTKNLNHITHK